MARALVTVDMEGLEPLVRGFNKAPELTREAARRAVNFAAERGRTLGSKAMRRQINFTPAYLNDKLKVTKFASPGDLSADVTGRDSPTSLARFAVNRTAFLRQAEKGKRKKRKKGDKPTVTVMVDAGRRVVMQDAFLVRLKNNNLGIAQRGGAGKRNTENPKYRLYRKRKDGTRVDSNYYLRYGPTVDQVFDKTRDQIAPGVGRALELETLRQLRLLGVTNG